MPGRKIGWSKTDIASKHCLPQDNKLGPEALWARSSQGSMQDLVSATTIILLASRRLQQCCQAATAQHRSASMVAKYRVRLTLRPMILSSAPTTKVCTAESVLMCQEELLFAPAMQFVCFLAPPDFQWGGMRKWESSIGGGYRGAHVFVFWPWWKLLPCCCLQGHIESLHYDCPCQPRMCISVCCFSLLPKGCFVEWCTLWAKAQAKTHWVFLVTFRRDVYGGMFMESV